MVPGILRKSPWAVRKTTRRAAVGGIGCVGDELRRGGLGRYPARDLGLAECRISPRQRYQIVSRTTKWPVSSPRSVASAGSFLLSRPCVKARWVFSQLVWGPPQSSALGIESPRSEYPSHRSCNWE